MSKTVEVLQNAFNADPNAIHALIVNRVPCNEILANDPFILVEHSVVLPNNNWQLTALGLINGILAANNLPLVEVKFSEKNHGASKIVGFCEYQKNEHEK